ncbi:hypothetical protein Taro_046225 [Colocasia esculenta]|uniref:Uncharacterized protein n=1 Tax=Colocasia esculenta TaxID=4460 RepID=A0A843X778_COLES|nr:hypothetical protein [Colocasia esculenta]
MDVVAAAAMGYGGEEGVVRFGIIDWADIARKVSRAIRLAPNAVIVAVGSRTLEKSRRFIADNWLDPSRVVAYGSYEEVQWVVAAAGKGKHLLLEKAGERLQGSLETETWQHVDGLGASETATPRGSPPRLRSRGASTVVVLKSAKLAEVGAIMAVGASKPTIVAYADGFFSVKNKMLVEMAVVEIEWFPCYMDLKNALEFPTDLVTSEAHPYPTGESEEDVSRPSSSSEPRSSGAGKFLEWLIEEIGVVEEMIRSKAPSV